MARAMIESCVSCFGMVPAEWKIVKLKSILSLRSVKSGGVGELLSVYLDRGVISYTDSDGQQVHKPSLDMANYQVVHVGDFVLNNQQAWRGSVGVSAYNGIISPAYFVYDISESCAPDYMNYLLRDQCMVQQYEVASRGVGTIQRNIFAPWLMNSWVVLPSLEEQQNIAVYLKEKCAEIDALMADIQSQIETLEQYKRSVITEAVTKGLNPNVPMKDSGTGWMGMVPSNWGRTRIKYCLCEIDLRSITGKEEPLSMSQRFGIIPTSQIDVPHTLASYVGAKIAHPGDLVFNKLKAHLGVFSVSQYTGLVSPDYAVYRAYENVNAKYLEYMFKTDACIAEFKKRITGVGQGLSRLYTSNLFAICVAIPQKVEQDTIVKMLDAKCAEIDAIIDGKRQQLSVLEEYKKSVIFEYVTGKKEVPVP